MTDKLSVLLVGAGNMGGALFSSWVDAGVLDPARSAVLDPNPTERMLDKAEAGGITVNPEDDGGGYDLCVIGVKPQLFGAVVPKIDFPNMDKACFLSIAAGMPISEIQNLLAERAPNAKVVRTMPNLPAAVRHGATLLCAGPGVEEAEKAGARALFEAAGETVWVETEDDIDKLTGVSGSGPAFIFHVAEAFEAAAISHGASPADARKLAEATLIGTAIQLREDGRSAEELRKAVTSPGGTTQAGLDVLMKDDALKDLINETVEAAYIRAKELAK